jgi:hypothetical protein
MTARESGREGLSNGRPTVALGWRLEKSLSAYANAALASGVSLLAITASSEAKVIYTKAHTIIPNSGTFVILDLNHDGVADFAFRIDAYSARPEDGSAFSLRVTCALSHSTTSAGCLYKNNKMWGTGVLSGRFASALRPGFKVGPNKSHFQQPTRAVLGGLMARYFFGGDSSGGYNGTGGQWLYTKHRYLGLEFEIGGQVHYGWARLDVTLIRPTLKGRGIFATLTGYAYETIPNKPIITGKTTGPDVVTLDPATLGHLAQGAPGISAWRKKK